MKLKPLRCLFGLWLLLAAALSRAEDIDIFLGRSASTAVPPSVLIILDNTANWNTPFTVEVQALRDTVSRVSPGAVNLGLMMFSETGGGNTGSDGGYVRAAVRLLDSSYQTKFVNLVNSLRVGEDKSNGGKAALAMMEAYRYFSGGAPLGGNNKNKTDYAGNTYTYFDNPSGKASPVDLSAASRAVWALSGNALASKSSSTYLPPAGLTSCGKTYIVYISNGAAQDNNSDITTVNNALSAAGGSITQIPLSPSGSQDNPADEVARFMSQSALGTTVYTVDVNKVTTGQGPGWTALLKSMATVSGGRYFDVSSTVGSDIANALDDIFTEIQSVNTSFASVSLPVSVNTQGTYLNQVFIGQFRPDQNGYPRWVGNLKQYRIGSTSTDLFLQDAAGSNAINSQTGFLAACARSYWTPSVLDTYWSFAPENNCPAVASSAASNYPDGPVVEKGGQAYRLRQLAGPSSRNVKTCSPTVSSCATLTNFDNANTTDITQSGLGVASSTDRTNLINWVRGEDNKDEDLDTNITELRPFIHGDVVHSRPVAINFGGDTTANRKVVVFYGANDGLFRAVNGNRDGELSIGGVAPGGELWSFAPPEFYSNFKRLRDNTDQVAFLGAAGNPKPYGMDGPVTYVKSGSNLYIYSVMRRGGRAIYAFNVTTPESPSLLWKVGCPNQSNDTGCGTALPSPLPSGGTNWGAADFAGLGQTWSSMVPLLATGYGGGTTPLLITGGGYDTCEDTDTNSTSVCGSPRGRKIFVLDAATGAMVKSFDTDRGVVGDITVVNNYTATSAGTAQYAYAADLGGNVYRINILGAAPASWTMIKIASLGCSTTATCAPRRKFMYGPDVVKEGSTYYLLLGSGDREKPLTLATQAAYPNARTVANHFFAIKDDLGSLSTEVTTCGSEVICMNSLLGITTSATPSSASLGSKKGWYLALAAEEQTATSAITLYGATTFSTTQPQTGSATSCTTLGTAKVYNVSYIDASSMNGTASRSETLPGGGLPPSPVAGRVTLDTGETDVPFVIGSRASSPLDAKKPSQVNTAGTNQPIKRVYRYIKK
jgi:type IV pilus assembly protein PilY1